MLVLDHIHQRLHNQLPDETTLHNGQKFDLLGLGLLGVPSLADHFNELQNKLQELKFDVGDYICMKFLLLLNPGNKNVNEGEIYYLLSIDYCNVRYDLKKLTQKLFTFFPHNDMQIWFQWFLLDRSKGHYQPKNCYRRLWECAGSIIGLHPNMLPVCDGKSRIYTLIWTLNIKIFFCNFTGQI